jgi:3-hydroxyisobutyrate dehydrogenase-like beta-hydroxyacid dehydrogenase
MLQKDRSQGRALAAESAIPFPMMAAAREIFAAEQAAGCGQRSQPALFALWHLQGGT